ncbi:Enoyl-CoA hydratase/isomerase [Psychromonas ingrahamii 37]|uniref:Enoyl-CoA hydratase/isomerase n=1 Tax=Psychromonas ingrahamii (strain DSM 17664 / CCUG 51855 / 37) TaxID=357804 RepID=A1SSP3_PSYIN|nr:enoyl-CoA hydratase-related protein [Psychromonas ingrahamii]ABM02508.1 Enoyl-CoA hydratase/isomerase [Psychromonas ingrahamii 37]
MTLNNESNFLQCSEKKGVLLIQFTHYEKRNALSNDCLNELAGVLDKAEQQNHIAAVVLTGGQRCFAAGADLNELATQGAIDTWLNPRPELWARLNKFSKPLLAAVNGYALGAGLELVLLCDIAISGQKALFGLPEITLGLIPGAGGTQRLARTVGKSLTNQMVLTGLPITAERALQAGLISEVVIPELTLERTIIIAETIAKRAPLAIKAAKQSLQQVPNSSLDQGLKFERQLFVTLAASNDRKEGIDAFFNKRQPTYKGS